MKYDFIRLGNLLFRISEITSLSLHTDGPVIEGEEHEDGWIIINKRTRINYLSFEDAWTDYNKASKLLAYDNIDEEAYGDRHSTNVIYSTKD